MGGCIGELTSKHVEADECGAQNGCRLSSLLPSTVLLPELLARLLPIEDNDQVLTSLDQILKSLIKYTHILTIPASTHL